MSGWGWGWVRLCAVDEPIVILVHLLETRATASTLFGELLYFVITRIFLGRLFLVCIFLEEVVQLPLVLVHLYRVGHGGRGFVSRIRWGSAGPIVLVQPFLSLPLATWCSTIPPSRTELRTVWTVAVTLPSGSVPLAFCCTLGAFPSVR